MSKVINVPIIITFSLGKESIDIKTNDVPTSLILESLSNITKLFAQQLVEEAKEEVPENGYEAYLDGRIKQDREILKNLLK